MKQRILKIIWGKLESRRAFHNWVVGCKDVHHTVVQFPASKLGAADGNFTRIAVPDEDRSFDGTNEEFSVDTSVNLNLSCVVQ